MSSTRSIISPPPFAADALTVIPPTPVPGVSYRDETAGPASSPDGWPYAERVNSAEFNQIMYQCSSLIAIMDKKGVLGWSSLVEYTENSVVLGSDGVLYEWLLASGPSNGGAKDPVSNPTFWRISRSGQLIAVRSFGTSQTYIPSPGTRLILADVQAAGGQGGGAPTGAAQNVSLGTGGHSGAHALVYLPMEGITSIALTVGARGSSAGAGAPGQSAASTSLGPYATCGGGPGGGVFGPTQAVGFYPSASALPAATVNAPAIAIETGGGNAGASGIILGNAIGQSGSGGPSQGFGGSLAAVAVTATGPNANQLGSGGGGAISIGASPAQVGGSGGAALITIYEYF